MSDSDMQTRDHAIASLSNTICLRLYRPSGLLGDLRVDVRWTMREFLFELLRVYKVGPHLQFACGLQPITYKLRDSVREALGLPHIDGNEDMPGDLTVELHVLAVDTIRKTSGRGKSSGKGIGPHFETYSQFIKATTVGDESDDWQEQCDMLSECLVECVDNGNLKAVGALLDAGADLNYPYRYVCGGDGSEYTRLMAGVAKGVGKGWIGNEHREQTQTLLCKAIQAGCQQQVEWLIEKRASVGDEHGVFTYGDADTVFKQSFQTSLHVAIASGHVQLCRHLLEAKANVNFPLRTLCWADRHHRETKMWTPLCMAASEDHSQLCSLLLEHRADPAELSEHVFETVAPAPHLRVDPPQKIQRSPLDVAKDQACKDILRRAGAVGIINEGKREGKGKGKQMPACFSYVPEFSNFSSYWVVEKCIMDSITPAANVAGSDGIAVSAALSARRSDP